LRCNRSLIERAQLSVGCGPVLVLRHGRAEADLAGEKLASGEAIGCFCLTEPKGRAPPRPITSHPARYWRTVNGLLNAAKQFVSNGKTRQPAVVFADRSKTLAKKGL